jgi:hypothetical protein
MANFLVLFILSLTIRFSSTTKPAVEIPQRMNYTFANGATQSSCCSQKLNTALDNLGQLYGKYFRTCSQNSLVKYLTNAYINRGDGIRISPTNTVGILAGNPMSVGAVNATLVTSAPVAFKKVRVGDMHLVALGVDGNAYAAGKNINHSNY